MLELVEEELRVGLAHERASLSKHTVITHNVLVVRWFAGQAYPDMLEVGRMEGSGESSAAESDAESASHFAAWAIVSAPLVLGFDLTNNTQLDKTWPVSV